MPAETLWAAVLGETRKLLGRDRTKVVELLAEERCSQAVLVFLATTDVGEDVRPVGGRGKETEGPAGRTGHARSNSHCAVSERE